MISKQKLKKIVREETGKGIGENAIKKVDFLLKNKFKEIIIKAARNTDFSGRKIIKEEDIE